MEGFVQDLRFGVRQLRKNPGFTAVSVITLALGIGANTFVFSVLNQVYFRPLQFRDPSTLAHVFVLGKDGDTQKLSYPEFLHIKDASSTLSTVSAAQATGMNLTGVEEPTSLQASMISDGFFEMLGARPVIGRTFSSSEFHEGANDVMVLSYWLWQRNFSGDPTVINQTVELNRKRYRIIGVLPPDFSVPVEAGNSEIWLPMVLSAADLQNNNQNVSVIGRLKTGRSFAQAQAEVGLIDQRFRDSHRVSADLGPLHVRVLTHQVDRGTSLFLGMLTIAVAFVLLIGCANVASLSLSRGASRRKEAAIRFAVGATRGRVLQQLFSEGLVLGLLGGVCGCLAALLGTNSLARWIGEQATFDTHVLFFNVGASLASGLLCGLLPAIAGSRVSLNNVLRDSCQPAVNFAGTLRVRQIFVIAQVAMSLTLLMGTGLIIRSLLKLVLTDPGFNPHGLLSVQIYLPTEKYATDNDRIAFFQRALTEVAGLPGTMGVAGTSSFPIYAPTFSRSFRIAGETNQPVGLLSEADINRTTASYLQLMAIPLIEGRYFTRADRDGTEGVAIVDESFKRQFLGNTSAIGTVLSIDADSGIRKTFTIIGVARNVINVGNRYELSRPRPIVYVPFAQFAPTTMTILLKAGGGLASFQAPLRHLLRSIDANLPLRDIRPVDDRLREVGNRSRQMLGVLGIFAISALLLSAIGIFGVIALSVSQRTREIGIRMALGAEKASVQFMFLRQGLALTTMGIALGLFGAFALTKQIESLLYGTSPNDLLTYFGASVVVTVIGVAAIYFPSRRATLVEPSVALRNQ